MIGRIQHPFYTAAALAAANPVLLNGEIVYESDTRRRKVGDGARAWNDLPYTSDAETVPALMWKVEDGMLYIKPATDLSNPILKRCKVGILHYKKSKCRRRNNPKTGLVEKRPDNTGFKLVQDYFAGNELTRTDIRIDPRPYQAKDPSGWMPLVSVSVLFERWVEKLADANFSGGGNSSSTAEPEPENRLQV